ncbi:hypothetical protein SNOG_06972 [Parastagonospora nodorum SN15]|uniref:Uncharacterized protein n=1 Tax=Phaeosphaeria nodorum (strain SN15 / ATCC MYA-4574 / FGSC 10173) TaxID=321614 RepID=Q0UMP2_PHANO|nr:hypothetical protein SNOG_06972 [Parastagonospora nodorum SN15]EAT85623.1 hypothetical protein SNOG_06972 [Parastagonospora nodorum SN15]
MPRRPKIVNKNDAPAAWSKRARADLRSITPPENLRNRPHAPKKEIPSSPDERVPRDRRTENEEPRSLVFEILVLVVARTRSNRMRLAHVNTSTCFSLHPDVNSKIAFTKVPFTSLVLPPPWHFISPTATSSRTCLPRPGEHKRPPAVSSIVPIARPNPGSKSRYFDLAPS